MHTKNPLRRIQDSKIEWNKFILREEVACEGCYE